MPSSWSSSLRFELQFTGENINLWGDKLNAVLQHADYAVAGWLTKALTGDYTLTTSNAGDDEARAAMLKFTGVLAAGATITIPSVSKSYFVYNATNKTLTFSTGAGATVSVDAGDKTVVFCDGATVHTVAFGGLPLKAYVDAAKTYADNLAWTYNAGNLPAQAGNAGKFITTDGATASWKTPSSADLSDYSSKILGVGIAFAVAL
ncbi:hypothetical protein DJ021_14205 [Phenylobacterium hankyongense]|uniref:Uncharacterized protein n=1 Tax=Phenylobacterium hankyongense TaxID=1813876 RepID=A0A328B0F2_9CAUL|nr:hypothetical protein [Phenylobacterium hankyongense]RAK60882.1 hypothetical protein DJ021_14205 [Phenylobacterium hankyongense]